jgi:TPR repeat protein
MCSGRKLKTFLMIFVVSLGVFAKTVTPEEQYIFTGKWETNGGISKLYDTPLGAVYRFNTSEYFDFRHFYKKNSIDNVYCLQFELPVFYKTKKKKYRFIVIDFKIRTFPAISECKNPKLVFSLTRSLSNADSITAYRNLNGISYFETGKDWHGISAPIKSPYRQKRIGNQQTPWSLDCGFSYSPYYKLVKCRVIFDTFKNGVVSTNVNGRKIIERHNEEAIVYPLGNSYGICIQHNSKVLPRVPLPRRLLEVSLPKITLTNNDDDLKLLSPVEIEEYPYSGYPKITEKINRIKNPDWLYAYAMDLLKGEDLIEAVEVLERAAKEEHIFAMYQLGVCYYRGIGVKADMDKAAKWLRRAAEYSMPEAVALLGLVSFQKDKTVYLFDKNQNALKGTLRMPLAGGGTHDNWIMERMFYYTEDYKAFLRNYVCSPKWAFWMASNLFIKDYYKDVVPPELLPKPEPDCDIKPIKIWIPKVPKKIADNNKPSFRIVIPPDYAKKKMLMKRYPATRFYDIRVEGLRGLGKEKFLLEQALEQEYLPAILYSGRIQAEISHDNKEALKIFEYGAKLGSLDCALESMHCRARLGDIGIGEFTTEEDVRFADYPLYYMLRYMVRNPDAPGVKEFLAQKYEDARKIWRQKPVPWNNFLLGAEALYQYFNYGFDTAAYRTYWKKSDDLTKAFKYLDKAAEKNIVPALYLSGKQYLEGRRSKGRLDTGKVRGLELLERADNAGHLKSRYLLIKNQFENQNNADKEFMKKLSPLRKADSANAWLLSTDIYAKLNKYNKKNVQNIINGYRRTASLGGHRAWDRLARFYYYGKLVPKDKDKAAKCWKKFIELDKNDRNQDFDDIFWSEIKTPVIVTYDEGGLPVPRGKDGVAKNKVKYYFERY